MADITLNCAKCGAPIPYDGSDVKTIQCPFCNSTIIVPVDLRPRKVATVSFSQYTPEPVNQAEAPNSNRAGVIAVTVLVGVLIIVGALIAILAFSSGDSESGAEKIFATPTVVITPTDTPEPSPTPAYEEVRFSFGQEGMNPGQFENARYIAIAGDKWIATSEYDNGRIQLFDLKGKFIRQWKTNREDATVQGLTADRQGRVYVSTGGSILVYDGETGEQLLDIFSPNGGEYGDLAITPEGNLAAIWYEGRWGIITSLEGHSEELHIFNSAGENIQQIASPISGMTGDLTLDVMITVDGKGNFYLMENSTIYVFSASGAFQNKFRIYDAAGEDLSVRSNITVDGQGNLYVADNRQVVLVDANGRTLKSFPTLDSVDYMALDTEENLWTISRTKVNEYMKTGF